MEEICLFHTAVQLPSTYTGFCLSDFARSDRTRTTAPAPSVTKEQSRTVSGSDTMRADSTSSMVSGSRIRASGLSWAHLRAATAISRSEEHTSELQSRENLVCRLLLEKKKRRY